MNVSPAIRVLLVEDSPVQRAIAAWVIRQAPGFVLAGEAQDGAEAVAQAAALKPDIVLMDCHMPRMNGIAATRAIMHQCPVPIVVTSASPSVSDIHPGMEALREGALAIVPKLPDPASPDFDSVAADLLLSLRLMAEVRVVRRVPPRSAREIPASAPPGPRTGIIALGASTGGPPVILEILRGLGPAIEVPVLVVQHMATGFLEGFRSWLARSSGLPVAIASPAEQARPGHVYLAPEDRHLGIDRTGRIRLSDGPAENGFRPSVSVLFRSVAEAFGARALAVLLTGMGEDGADGLSQIAARGGTTVIQDFDSSVVFGMPGAAQRLGVAQHVLPPADIARFILGQLARKSTSP